MFTKQHYKQVAMAMQSGTPPHTFTEGHVQHYRDCLTLANMFERDNPSFDQRVFLRACGYYDGAPQGMSQNGTNLTQPTHKTT